MELIDELKEFLKFPHNKIRAVTWVGFVIIFLYAAQTGNLINILWMLMALVLIRIALMLYFVRK
ncbi:MAG: hypothetical protein ABIG20_02775 [archaeon]